MRTPEIAHTVEPLDKGQGNLMNRRVAELPTIFGLALLVVVATAYAGPRVMRYPAEMLKRASVFADFSCDGPATRPHRIVLTCADANLLVEKIHWSSWGGRVARGRGTVVYNDCNPFCAGGHFHRVPGARLHMTHAGHCSNTGHDQYHHLTIRSPAFTNRKHLYRRTVGCRTFGAPRLSASADRIYFFENVGVEQAPRVRPSRITFNADGNNTVTRLRWHGWGSKRATATGTSHVDNCRPNCAQGHISRLPVHVRLSRRGVLQHRKMYRCYRVSSATGSGPRGCL